MKDTGTHISKYWQLITIVIAAVIITSSLIPLDQFPQKQLPGTDKIHHIIGYALLAFPCALSNSRYLVVVIVSFITLGGAIELLQPYVNRTGEWLDLLANIAGIAIGTCLGKLLFTILGSQNNEM